MKESFKIALREHDITAIISDLREKKNISNPHVIGMPLNEQFQFFSHAVLSSQTSRIPDETQKNPRTENKPPLNQEPINQISKP